MVLTKFFEINNEGDSNYYSQEISIFPIESPKEYAPPMYEYGLSLPKIMPSVARQRQREIADTKNQDFMGYDASRRHESYRIVPGTRLIYHLHHVLELSASKHNRYHHVHGVENYW